MELRNVNKHLNKYSILNILCVMLLFFPILKLSIISKIIILITGYLIINFWKDYFQSLKDKKTNRLFLTIIAFYVFSTITLLYSKNFGSGLRELKTLLSLPIILFITTYGLNIFKKLNYLNIFKFFILSNFLFSVLYNLYFFNSLITECFYLASELNFIDKLTVMQRKDFKYLLSCLPKKHDTFFFIHKAYNSINLLITLCLLDFYFDKIKRKANKFMMIVLSAFILWTIFLLQSKLNILLAGGFFVMSFMKHTFKIKFKSSYAYILISVTILFFVKLSNFDFDNEKRMYIYSSGVELIQEKPLFGYGIGGYHQLMSEMFSKIDYEPMRDLLMHKTDSHNVFLKATLSGGIILLFFYLIMIYENFKIAFSIKHPIFLIILLFFLLNFLQESILRRMIGVVSFSIFIGVMNLFYLHKQKGAKCHSI